MIRHLDLFSGIGGFALAARWAGIETVAFCEKDPFCQKVLAKHWPHTFIFSDVNLMLFTEHVDILTAGFPCQPFSIAGKQRGKDDERYLWPHTMRIIKSSRPTWCILENVPGIIPHLDPMLEDLETEGYDWRAYLIPASAVSAPHKRERLWIIANRDGKRCDDGGGNWHKRYLQANQDGYVEEIQSQWSQFIPNTWTVMQARDWLDFNADLSRKNDGLSNRVDRVRAIGNSIVPQIPYLFMKIIKSLI